MKKVLFVAVSIFVLTACTNVKVENSSEDFREIKGFERIVQNGSMDVKYQQGDEFSVVVKARKSDVENVITRVEGNNLIVSMKGSSKVLNFGWTDGDDVTVYITSPDLVGIEVKGSGDFKCKNHLDTDNLDVSLKGSGDIDLYDVICDRVNVSVVGSGEVKINKLQSQQSNVSLVGSGDVKINQQQVKQTRLALQGSGDIKVNFVDCGQVESSLMGSGDITLIGNVVEHKFSKRGSGDFDVDKLTVGK